MKKIVLLMFFIPFVATATVRVERNSSGELFMYGSTCHEVMQQLQAFRHWTHSLGERLGREPRPSSLGSLTVPSAQMACRVSLEGSAPAFVIAHYGQHPLHDGPNCFNTTLILAGLASAPTHTQGPELSAWLSSPFCQTVGSRNQLQPGDIGIFHGLPTVNGAGEDGIIHAFIHISSDLTFSKSGLTRRAPFEVQTLSRALQEYHMNNVPRRCSVPTPSSRDGCEIWLTYYRCRPPQLSSFPRCLRETVQSLNHLTQVISNSALYQESPLSNLQDLARTIEVIGDFARDQRRGILARPRHRRQDTLEAAFWALISERLNSLGNQLSTQSPVSFAPWQRIDNYTH